MATLEKTALVIGATGGFGGAVAERMLADGWRVRALARDPAKARRTADLPGIEWRAGDAMFEADVVGAAEGVAVIVHGANPPGYRNWAGLAPAMLANTIAAARASGARIVFPGNVYNYGPDAFPHIAEDAPQTPATRKGRVRVDMESMLRGSGVPVLILRAGDFISPRPGAGNWFTQGLVKSGRPIAAVTYPGPLDIAHAWIWLPDMAEACVRLLATDLAAFEVFHLAGQTLTGREMATALEAIAGRRLKVSRLPWIAVHAAAPFNETMREMQEMRYLWNVPVLMDNARIVARLGGEPHTPLADVLRSALAGMEALPSGLAAAA